MKIHKMEQRSDEWFAIRRGKMTASNAQCIAANGKGLETYIYALLAEKYSNNKESFINDDMRRGVELEDQARMTYEIENESVEVVGFVEQDEFVGCSPDGLVGEEGGLEIKCVNDVNFFKVMVNGKEAIDSKYLWQAEMCLYVSGRKWWDIVFYNVNFDKNMLVFRIEPTKEQQAKLKAGIEKGKELIKTLETKYNERQQTTD